jgi:hypothetical protein
MDDNDPRARGLRIVLYELMLDKVGVTDDRGRGKGLKGILFRKKSKEMKRVYGKRISLQSRCFFSTTSKIGSVTAIAGSIMGKREKMAIKAKDDIVRMLLQIPLAVIVKPQHVQG